ncbi:hypothetical protein CW736_13900 [Nonlabens sp. MB-3u-79]|jgi:hypothetical protein|uniref:DUF6913 domain-containing protein n=1 Tax=Nonlabens sp. MB-3u-79 TaxID=2058134 RepID=UPI000C3111CA|nr:hypothetical protein [Nonlabens sp. MB-3u-79]AUC80403.1 hypothetical protein CW736_13900 [Nonlabens sp. MB-3u-79]
MIFDILKQRWLRKEFYKLENISRSHQRQWPQSLVVVFDANKCTDVELFKKWCTALQIPLKNLSLLGYTDNVKKNALEGVTLFDNRVVKWYGGLKEGPLSELLTAPYDLQINYYEKPSQITTYVSRRLDANFKVGHASHKENTYDLAVNVPLTKQELFISEIAKYLKILNP